MPKRTLSGTHITPPKIRRPNHSKSSINSHLTPLKRVKRPIPVDARPHMEYLSKFDLTQVIQWHKLCQKSQTKSTDTEVEAEVAIKPESLPVTATQKAEKSSTDENRSSYPCTFCDRTYKNRGTWMRHEASYHEPQEEWICPSVGCNRKFSTGNKFRRHHKEDHGCVNCTHNRDPNYTVGPLAKSAWGCGFCIAFLESWEIRQTHLESHFQKGLKKSEWDHSKVIQGLLLRPSVNDAWKSLMSKEYGPLEKEWPVPGWSRDSFGQLLTTLRYDLSQESAVEAARLTYIMLLPVNPKNNHLSEIANNSSGNSFLAIAESTLMSNGDGHIFNSSDTLHYLDSAKDSTQNPSSSRDDAAAEAMRSIDEYSVFQLAEDTIGIDWMLWPN
ncbi:hypothetical protein F4860DRAFT_338305 [Xylaria cubensis]|nr:hypothetical protein F4860DRAFT_338305 [Xylaria cubensis]